MKNKIICLLLVMVLSVLCLAGCFNKDNGGNNDGGNTGDNGNTDNGGNNGNTGNNNGGKPNIGGGGTDEGDWWEDINYDTTSLLFQMTKCTNAQELPSGCERYLAGEGVDVGDSSIDELIAERNANAYDLTKVEVDYEYYEDNQALYGFSNAMDIIYAEIQSANSSTPDMYCNWMTDLLICSLKGCFANLYSKTYGAGDYQGDNHFNLENNGYMADLMGSLTLSTNKIYVIASDYFIDLIRAFFVVPVNVSLFNSIANTMYPEDLNGDDVIDINDFFYEVKPCDCENIDDATECTEDCADGGWTYDRLIQFCQKIYKRAGDGTTESIHDTLGFGLGLNGLPAAGLVYTSSVTIINKEWDEDAGKYNYSYPDENQALYDLADKVSAMMDIDGIMAVSSADAIAVGMTGDNAKALLGVRKQFTSDKMLFGGIILVGSLEYQEYQDMKTGERGGFGVVPVPVYKAGDDYLTQIHVVGRAGAIRFDTEKFVQCSAFLHYQSANSEEIKNDYYEFTLVRGTASGIEGNIEMLQYIRRNVRTSFDKLFEDAIGFMYADVDENSVGNRFHNLLCNDANKYKCDLRGPYASLLETKRAALRNLEEEYKKLPA